MTVQVLPAPKVSFSGELTSSSTVRACAGGIDDHTATDPQYRAHTRFVTAKAQRNGQPVPNLNLIFKFAGNVGHDYSSDPAGVKPAGWTSEQIRTARLLDSDAPPLWKEELARTTNEQAQVALTVKSSDVISQPALEAHWTNEQGQDVLVGSVGCDFAEAETLRRFDNPDDPDEPFDAGWLFRFPALNALGDTTPAKVYLKFRKDQNRPDLAGNWNAVNGHLLLIRVEEAVLRNDYTQISGDPDELKPYGFITSGSSGPQSTNEVAALRTTDGDGATATQVYANAGLNISQVAILKLKADDFSQWSE